MDKDQAFELWYWHMDEWEGGDLSDPPKKVDTDDVATKHGIRYTTWQRRAPQLFGLSGSQIAAAFHPMSLEHHQGVARWFWDEAGGYFIEDGRIAALFTEIFWASGYAGIRWYQRALSRKFGVNLRIDGRVGKITASVVNSANQDELFAYLVEELRNRYRYVARNPEYSKYLKGWLNRVDGDSYRKGIAKTLTVTHCKCCGQIIKP